MQDSSGNNYIIVNPYKSVAGSILLAFFLGSFGLLYSSFKAGLIITIIAILGLAVPKVGFLIFFLCWLVCPFIAAFKTSRYNAQLLDILQNRDA